MNSKVRIIYILGDGRSGSTLLESVLNASEVVVSVGECFRFWERFYPAVSLCGCGQKIDQCELWSSVHETMKSLGEYDVIKIRAQIKRLLLYRNFNQIPNILQSSEYSGFADKVVAFYESISRISGKRVIIDSSKSPSWAKVLSSIDRLEITYLHIERELPYVAASWRKKVRLPEFPDAMVYMPMKSTFNAVRTWVRVKLLSHRLRGLNYLYVGYADFCNSSEARIRSIFEFVKLDLPASIFYRPNHGIAGNPMRLMHGTEPIVIAPSANQKPENLNRMTSVLLTLLGRTVNFLTK